VDVTVAACVLENEGRVLFVRRAEGRLLGRMWELPQTSLEARGLQDLVAELRERHGLEVETGALVARARHAITFRRIRVEAYRGRLRREPPRDPDRFRWAGPDDIARLPMSSLSRKVLAGLQRAQRPLDLGSPA
jgi:adenine-specific DNA glycosylase